MIYMGLLDCIDPANPYIAIYEILCKRWCGCCMKTLKLEYAFNKAPDTADIFIDIIGQAIYVGVFLK